VLSYRIDTHAGARATCPQCGTPIAGRFGRFSRGFGRRRIAARVPVH
jgi:pyruvate formate lyase activating enzyme